MRGGHAGEASNAGCISQRIGGTTLAISDEHDESSQAALHVEQGESEGGDRNGKCPTSVLPDAYN